MFARKQGSVEQIFEIDANMLPFPPPALYMRQRRSIAITLQRCPAPVLDLQLPDTEQGQRVIQQQEAGPNHQQAAERGQ